MPLPVVTPPATSTRPSLSRAATKWLRGTCIGAAAETLPSVPITPTVATGTPASLPPIPSQRPSASSTAAAPLRAPPSDAPGTQLPIVGCGRLPRKAPAASNTTATSRRSIRHPVLPAFCIGLSHLALLAFPGQPPARAGTRAPGGKNGLLMHPETGRKTTTAAPAVSMERPFYNPWHDRAVTMELLGRVTWKLLR